MSISSPVFGFQKVYSFFIVSVGRLVSLGGTQLTSASVNWWTASTTREIRSSEQETFMKSALCSAHRTTSLIRSSMVCLFDVLSIGHPAPRGRLLCQLLNRLISFLNHLQHIRVEYTEHEIYTQHDEHNRERNCISFPPKVQDNTL